MSKKNAPDPKMPPAPCPNGAPPLPDVLQDFIKAISPAAQKPTEELTARFKKETTDNSRGFIVPGSPKSGPEYFVELRIREWIYRMEREAAAQRKQAQQNNKPPQGPPKP